MKTAIVATLLALGLAGGDCCGGCAPCNEKIATSNTVYGQKNYAKGSGNYLNGAYNTAIGFDNTGKGYGNFLKGKENYACGVGNRVVGVENEVQGRGNFACGERNDVEGKYNRVIGQDNVVECCDEDCFNYSCPKIPKFKCRFCDPKGHYYCDYGPCNCAASN